MSLVRKKARPPSRLKQLTRALAVAIPKGLPKSVESFYAAGDGLTVTIHGAKSEIVGLEKMFDGLENGKFRAHAPVTRKEVDDGAVEWGGRPFFERFFNDEDDFSEKKDLERLNLLLRLKLLSSIEGESTELAIDFFGKKSPTLYLVEDARDAFPLDLTFDAFVECFEKFGGNHRWYLAFLDKAAEKTLNLELRAEVERSLAVFPAEEIAPFLKRLPKKKVAAPPPPAPAVESAEPTLRERWIQEAKEALEDDDEDLYFASCQNAAGAWPAFVEAVDSGAIGFDAVWALRDGPQHLPARLVPGLFAARRRADQDKLWPRVTQVLTEEVFKAIAEDPAKLQRLAKDPMLEDVIEVLLLCGGHKPAGTASPRIAKQIGEWAFAPPFINFIPKQPAFNGKDVTGSHAARLRLLADALVGADKAAAEIRGALQKVWVKKKFAQLNDAAMVLAAATFEPKDLGQIAMSVGERALELVARNCGWTKAEVMAVASAQRGNDTPATLKKLAAKLK